MRLAFLLLLALPLAGRAQTAQFDESTDTIQLSAPTTVPATSTYEAVVLFPSDGGVGGVIYNEWTSAVEDKLLQFYFSATGLSTLVGYNFPGSGVLAAEAEASADAWHHVAFVYDGTEERLYLDGQKVAARPRSGAIGNGGGRGHIGAIGRDGTVLHSLRGYLDSFRISSIARYTGDSFTPPLGDLTSDGDTVLLLNFNEPAGSVTVQDESPNGRTGTLGVGFPTATPPTLGGVPVATEPEPGADLALRLAPYPNPTAGPTTLAYALPEPGPVRLTVLDVLGRAVAVLADGAQAAGWHEATLDAADLPSGVYVARLDAGGAVQTRRLTVVR